MSWYSTGYAPGLGSWTPIHPPASNAPIRGGTVLHGPATSAATSWTAGAAQPVAASGEISPPPRSPALLTLSQRQQFGSSEAGRKRAKLDMSTYDFTWDVKKYSSTDPSRLVFEELENELYTRVYCSGPGCSKSFDVRSLTGPERRDMQAVGCSRRCASGWVFRYGKTLKDLHRPCLRCPETHITNSQKRIGKRGGWPLRCFNVLRNIRRSLNEAKMNEARMIEAKMDEVKMDEAELNETRANVAETDVAETNEAEGTEATVYQDCTLPQSLAAVVKMDLADDEHGVWETPDEVEAECAGTAAGPAPSVRTILEREWPNMCQRGIDEMVRARLTSSIPARPPRNGTPQRHCGHSGKIPIYQLLNHPEEDKRSSGYVDSSEGAGML